MGKTVIVWYSATGNTLFLAKQFPDAELIRMDAVNEGEATLPEDTDRLGIFYPVYCFGLPLPVLVFIREYLAKRDNSALGYIFAVDSCGGFSKNAQWAMERELQEIGLSLSYSASVKMPDGYLPFLKSAPDEEQTADARDKALESLKTIIQETTEEKIQLPRHPFLSAVIRGFSGKLNMPKTPEKRLVVTDRCVGCGLCTKLCPMDNLTIQNGKAKLGSRCISCFACYHRCPHYAISFGKKTGQYKGLVKNEELFRR